MTRKHGLQLDGVAPDPGTGWRTRCLGSLEDFAGANAGSAHLERFMRAIDDGVDATEIGIPAAPGDIVSVADVIPVLRALSANITTLCHSNTSSKL